MTLSEQIYDFDEAHPIDIVEQIASFHAWSFDRLTDDQITMSLEGQWRNYAITLAWSARDEILRLICSFEIAPPDEALPRIYDAINQINDMCWTGAFTYLHDQYLMLYRYGLVLGNDQFASSDQLDRLIASAIAACEQYYPAFQLVSWTDQNIEDALKIAISEPFGRA